MFKIEWHKLLVKLQLLRSRSIFLILSPNLRKPNTIRSEVNGLIDIFFKKAKLRPSVFLSHIQLVKK